MTSWEWSVIRVVWPAGTTRPGPRQSTAGAHWPPLSPIGSGSSVVTPVTVTLPGYWYFQPHWNAVTCTFTAGVGVTASTWFSVYTVNPNRMSTMITGTTM